MQNLAGRHAIRLAKLGRDEDDRVNILEKIKEYDRILVFKEGELVESGTHEDLMKLHGQYEYLYSLQARRYE